MTDKELRKLGRAELVEMLLTQSRENDELRKKLAVAEEQLGNKQIMLDKAGSIAEASLQVNHVFEAAEKAANQYLENIQALSGRQEEVCARMEEECRRKTQQMMAKSLEKCQSMESETEEKCRQMIREAETRTNGIWEEIQARVKQLMQQQAGLKNLLDSVSAGPGLTQTNVQEEPEGSNASEGSEVS